MEEMVSRFRSYLCQELATFLCNQKLEAEKRAATAAYDSQWMIQQELGGPSQRNRKAVTPILGTQRHRLAKALLGSPTPVTTAEVVS